MTNLFTNIKGKIIIPKIAVDAPIFSQKVQKDGIMPAPDCPDDVVLYDFSNFKNLGGILGKTGNSILSGHVDSGQKPCKGGTVKPPCEAVFWDLDQLQKGDEIKIEFKNKKYEYRVTSAKEVRAETKEWKKIIASSKKETITLITCAGEFDEANRKYSTRLAVKAQRINS